MVFVSIALGDLGVVRSLAEPVHAFQATNCPTRGKVRQKDGRQSQRHRSVTLSARTFRTLGLQVEEGHSETHIQA